MVTPSLPHVIAFNVDGVAICGRPRDGRHWATDLEAETDVSLQALQDHFFKIYWHDVVHGRADLDQPLQAALTQTGSAPTSSFCWMTRQRMSLLPKPAVGKPIMSARQTICLSSIDPLPSGLSGPHIFRTCGGECHA